MPGRIFEICDRYESGYGHGLANDGLDLNKTPHADRELGEAYRIGYEAGQEAYSRRIVSSTALLMPNVKSAAYKMGNYPSSGLYKKTGNVLS